MDSAVAQHQGSGLSWPDHYLLRSEVNFILRGEIKTGLLFGVFDGHYDKGRAGDFLKTDLTAALEKIFTESEDSDGANEDVVTDALSRLFLDVSESYRKADGKGGASVTSIFVLDDQVYCANAGDCRTILVRAKDTKQLSEDASLRNPHFQKWHANQQNDIVNWCGKFEVHKSEVRLNIARDVGAFEWMCHRPKITSVCIADQPDDIENGKVYCTSGDFLVLGSDGLSEPATVEEVGAAVRKLANAGASPQVIADVIAKKAGSYPGNDYVTVLVIPI
jgi:serine/threonine protein phosphatase PrpC